MANQPRNVTIRPISFRVSFGSVLRPSEFSALCDKIGATLGVAEITMSHINQSVKVVIDEAFIDEVSRIRRDVLDMLMGNNCSPHLR